MKLTYKNTPLKNCHPVTISPPHTCWMPMERSRQLVMYAADIATGGVLAFGSAPDKHSW